MMNSDPVFLYSKRRREVPKYKQKVVPPAVLDEKIEALKVLANSILFEVSSLQEDEEVEGNTDLGLAEEVQRFEEQLIRSALLRSGGQQRRAAVLLGVKPTTLNAKMKRYGMIRDNNIDDLTEIDEEA